MSTFINNPAEVAKIEKGTFLIVTLEDSTTVQGEFISVNSKGINLKDASGKTITRSMSRVTDVETNDEYLERREDEEGLEDAELEEEMDEDEENEMLADEFTSGETNDLADDMDDADELLSAAEAAALFNIEAKALRVIARAAGLSVGQGRQYAFTGEDLKALRAKKAELDKIAAEKAAAAAAEVATA